MASKDEPATTLLSLFLPKEKAELLLKLFKEDNSLIQTLGILDIELFGDGGEIPPPSPKEQS